MENSSQENKAVALPVSYPELPEAQNAFEKFVQTIPPHGLVVILCDGDVDGLGAGTVLWHYLARNGFGPERLVAAHVPKGGNAFTPEVSALVQAHKPSGLAVLDLGIRDYAIAPGVTTLLVDHHRPEGEPPGSTVLTGYLWRPVPTSSLLTYLLCNHAGQVRDRAWTAAIGNAGDLGPDYPELQQAAKEQKLKYIKEATSLLNSAKRSSDPDRGVPAAFRAMRDAESARELVEGDNADLRLLRELKAEVQTELSEARKAAPRFSRTEKVALIRFDSSARVHPLLAQSWRRRLPKYIVLAANGGYLPGKVSFSARTDLEVNLLDFLARHGEKLDGAEAEYGHGHDKATGGTVSYQNFERLLQSMGFE
ncbi:MAG TPA: hypothetical protein VH186_05060 [Chloroflexia bacterium]|nr:hypothetical protein [Chloroflexia bacterium]